MEDVVMPRAGLASKTVEKTIMCAGLIIGLLALSANNAVCQSHSPALPQPPTSFGGMATTGQTASKMDIYLAEMRKSSEAEQKKLQEARRLSFPSR